ncbi:MAG: hypothetical protein QOE65_389 [Solirubrobacteraceae bacterium]|jgi:uncharacterized membrane protein|nr:hypothetical protein [Solirubrobacteraceae bacterium]
MHFGIGHSALGRAFAALAVLLALGAVVGMALLWPTGERNRGPNPQGKAPPVQRAKIYRVEDLPCTTPQASHCRRITARLLEGPAKGGDAVLEFGNGGRAPKVQVGDVIRVVRNEVPAGTPAGATPPYSFQDFERRAPMLWLALAFAALVIVFGRLRGLMSLVGLGISLAVVVVFILPAILDGRSPVPVAVAGALAIMVATIALAHGVGPKSIAAILGTAVSLAVTLGLAEAFSHLAHLTGLSSEESNLLLVGRTDLDLRGLVLAGMVIGALGVLDDVTVSQASTVMALRRANPAQRALELYRGALSVGRDHVAATVNTLVLAYVGASLPILLVFTVGHTPFSDAINVESVATQVVATLVGSIGLITAVPVTTALAALLASRLRPDEVGDVDHAHAH